MQTANKTKGRPSQDKVIRPYTIDRKIAEFIDSLPDGERSRFVNNILVRGIEGEKLPGKYYAYVLMRPDGSVFYVGKGTGNRINEHEGEARNGAQSHKCNIIRKVWSEGGQIIKQKVAFFDDEEEAYDLEISLIAFFGLENLANKRNGGEGGSVAGQHKTPEEDTGIVVTFYLKKGDGAALKRLLTRQLGREPTKQEMRKFATDQAKKGVWQAIKDELPAIIL
jgi:hypothetical protein